MQTHQTQTNPPLTEAQKAELRWQMYERIARGHAITEAENTAQQRRQGRVPTHTPTATAR